MIVCHKCGWRTGEKGQYEDKDGAEAVKHEIEKHLGVNAGDSMEMSLFMEKMTREYTHD